MNSYISHFKEWIVAAAILVALEGTIYAVGAPSPFDRTNFFQFAFYRAEPPQRLFVFHKLRAFANLKPTIVQSGDSSGFYGIEPAAVMRHLPPGVSYLNMSCCANLGFRGYYNILEFMAEHNASVRYMVLYITPYTMPRPEMWDADGANIWGIPDLEVFGNAIYQEFMGPWRILHLPSMGFRRQVSNAIYYLYFTPLFNHWGLSASHDQSPLDSEAPLDYLRLHASSNDPYFAFLRIYRETHGWMPESDQRGGVYASECELPVPKFLDLRTLSYKSYLEDVLESFAALARRHSAVLVVAFQPAACVFGTGVPSAEARAIVDEFKRKNPDVEVPFPLIETWPVEKFSVPAHVRREYTDLVGDRLGKAMAEIISRRGYN